MARVLVNLGTLPARGCSVGGWTVLLCEEKKRFSFLVFYFFLDEPPRQKDGITDFHLKLLLNHL